jgi:hypothetical protein
MYSGITKMYDRKTVGHVFTIFFLWRYVKDRVFVPPLPRDPADLKARIIATVKNIDAPMLTRVWQELEYRIDVCRVTRGAHIEHLKLSKKNFFSFPVAVNNSINVGRLIFLL